MILIYIEKVGTKRELGKIKISKGITCNDPNCKNANHIRDIAECYDSIVRTLNMCSNYFQNKFNALKKAIVPGWNEHVRDVRYSQGCLLTLA